MLKFQTPMSNDEVCRVMTDKQTHKHTKRHTYRIKTEETFLTFKFFNFKFLFKKAVSKNPPVYSNLKVHEGLGAHSKDGRCA